LFVKGLTHTTMKQVIELLSTIVAAVGDSVGRLKEIVGEQSPTDVALVEKAWRALRSSLPDLKPTGGAFHAGAQLLALVLAGVVKFGDAKTAFRVLVLTENGSAWRQLYEPVEKEEGEKPTKPTVDLM